MSIYSSRLMRVVIRAPRIVMTSTFRAKPLFFTSYRIELPMGRIFSLVGLELGGTEVGFERDFSVYLIVLAFLYIRFMR